MRVSQSSFLNYYLDQEATWPTNLSMTLKFTNKVTNLLLDNQISYQNRLLLCWSTMYCLVKLSPSHPFHQLHSNLFAFVKPICYFLNCHFKLGNSALLVVWFGFIRFQIRWWPIFLLGLHLLWIGLVQYCFVFIQKLGVLGLGLLVIVLDCSHDELGLWLMFYDGPFLWFHLSYVLDLYLFLIIVIVQLKTIIIFVIQ